MSSSKDLEYSPLHDEISLDSSENIHTDLTVIKNHKKAVF
jgi:exo-beta-1,3-glucanase (GH17 family)